MQIDFFEEFPTSQKSKRIFGMPKTENCFSAKSSLGKLKLINWPSLIYIAAPSLQKFRQLEKQSKKINPKLKYGYWPILKKREGYWLSPWSKRKALIRIINELKKNKKSLIVLWDWEKPFLTPYLFITQAKNKEKNKQLIYDFFKKARKYKIELAFAEASPQIENKFGDRRIIMAYSSDFQIAPVKTLKNKIKLGKKFKNRLWIGLGCISYGILRIEPKLSPKKLDRDLSIVKNSGINKVVIFRLGGLNKKYIEILKKYV